MARIIVCDKCGKNLNETSFWKIRMSLNSPDELDYDLCEKCGDRMLNFIKLSPVKALNEQDGGNGSGKE